MKKLKRLQINHDKLMNNDELLALSGGYGSCEFYCWVYYDGGAPAFNGVCCGDSGLGCEMDCNAYWNPRGAYCQCI